MQFLRQEGVWTLLRWRRFSSFEVEVVIVAELYAMVS